jgi:SAM-dependent methyltransferase
MRVLKPHVAIIGAGTVLFNGAANATRRQALPPLWEVFAGRDQRRWSLLDVGCGTGRFLDFVKQTWPRLPALVELPLRWRMEGVGAARRCARLIYNTKSNCGIIPRSQGARPAEMSVKSASRRTPAHPATPHYQFA